MHHRHPADASRLCSELGDAVGYNALHRLNEWMRKKQLVSYRRIIINPGEGSTGTSALTALLREAFGINRFANERENIELIPPSKFATTNWSHIFKGADAIVDEPTAQIFPFLLAAFPNALVVHTVQEPLKWTQRRQAGAPRPFASYFAPLSRVNVLEFRNRTDLLPELSLPTYRGLPNEFNDAIIDALLLSAHNHFVRCSVPRERYFPVNVFEGDTCAPYFLPRLSHFLNRTFHTPHSYRPPGCSGRSGQPTQDSGTPEDREALAYWGLEPLR